MTAAGRASAQRTQYSPDASSLLTLCAMKFFSSFGKRGSGFAGGGGAVPSACRAAPPLAALWATLFFRFPPCLMRAELRSG